MTKTFQAWPGWLALVLMLIAVSLLAQLVTRSFFHKVKAGPVLVNNPEKPVTPISTQPPVKFDFYTVLPKMAVAVPLPPPVDVPAAAKATSAQTYILQIAAVRQLHDAEHLRDQLHSAGFPVFIHSYQADQITWYRVMVGPYSSPDLAQRTQAQLQQRQITALILKK